MHVGCAVERTLEPPLRAVQTRVEADGAGQAELLVRRCKQRFAAAEAEADTDEARLADALADGVQRGHRVGLDLRRARLRHVLHEVEVGFARTESGRAA